MKIALVYYSLEGNTAFAAAMIGGYQYFARRGEKRGYRAV